MKRLTLVLLLLVSSVIAHAQSTFVGTEWTWYGSGCSRSLESVTVNANATAQVVGQDFPESTWYSTEHRYILITAQLSTSDGIPVGEKIELKDETIEGIKTDGTMNDSPPKMYELSVTVAIPEEFRGQTLVCTYSIWSWGTNYQTWNGSHGNTYTGL